MVEVGQIAVSDNGSNLKISSVIFNTIDYIITVERETDFGTITEPFTETEFNEQYGNLTWITPY